MIMKQLKVSQGTSMQVITKKDIINVKESFKDIHNLFKKRNKSEMRFLFKKGWSKECINDKFFATVFIVDNETKIWHELVENQREPYLDFVPNKVPGIFEMLHHRDAPNRVYGSFIEECSYIQIRYEKNISIIILFGLSSLEDYIINNTKSILNYSFYKGYVELADDYDADDICETINNLLSTYDLPQIVFDTKKAAYKVIKRLKH